MIIGTKVRAGLQVSLHGVDQVPARQEDQNRSRHLQRLDVLQQSLHQLKGRLLLVDLSHGALRLHCVVRLTDQVTVGLWGEGRTEIRGIQINKNLRSDSKHIHTQTPTDHQRLDKGSYIIFSTLLVLVSPLAVIGWRDEAGHLDAVLQEVL